MEGEALERVVARWVANDSGHRTGGTVDMRLTFKGQAVPCGSGWKEFGAGTALGARHAGEEPSCLLYLTDGCGPAPDRPPPYPVLWVLTSDGRPPAGWGGVVRLEKE